MLALTLEERGAYNTCLDLIYDREGPIPDDARWLSGWMGVSSRKWATIRASLIVKAKLFAVNVNGVPSLMNQRAAIELENQSNRSRELAENGAKGGRKVAEQKAKDNKNNAPPQAPVKLYTGTVTGTDNDDDSASARFSDWDGEDLGQLESLLREAAGEAVNVASPMLQVVAPVLALMRPGAGPACDLRLDVLPAIRAAAPKVRRPADRWDYFVPMISQARDARLRGAPAMADVVPLRATGPPSFADQQAAVIAEARRRVLES